MTGYVFSLLLALPPTQALAAGALELQQDFVRAAERVVPRRGEPEMRPGR